jgi:hypothetical protein
MSANKRSQFVNDRMSFIILRGDWSEVIVQKVLPQENTINSLKDCFYEELER